MEWFKSIKSHILFYLAGFCALLLAVILFLDKKSTDDSEKILGESIRSQLIAICSAAHAILDPAFLDSIASKADTENSEYEGTLANLRSLAISLGAKYIYVVKRIDDKYVFIFDTDTVEDTRFKDYGLSSVHEIAFAGTSGADLMNVRDEYGSFSTGAVPVNYAGKVIAIVSADIEDKLIAEHLRLGRLNTYLLFSSVTVTMVAMLFLMASFLRRIKAMRDRLTQMAHYDSVTGLPNRQFLLEYLGDFERGGKDETRSFALFFIDLDNFKKVNDTAGHDAGDALLKRIGNFLSSVRETSRQTRVFRPAAGKLNVAARIGGDEFIIVMHDVSDALEAGLHAERMLSSFQMLDIDGHIGKFDVGMSVGIAIFPLQSEDIHAIIKYADIAMYHAKNSGKNCYRVYEDEMPDKNEK